MCVIHDFWILQFRRHNKRSVSTVLRFSSRRVYLNRTTHRRSHFMQIKSNASLTFLIFLRYFYLQLMICKWILTSHLFMHRGDEMETYAMYRTSHSFHILYYIVHFHSLECRYAERRSHRNGSDNNTHPHQHHHQLNSSRIYIMICIRGFL